MTLALKTPYTAPSANARCANFELLGPPGRPVIAVLGGISASRHVTSSLTDQRGGWWQDVVGSRKALDTECFRVLSFDYVTQSQDGGPVRTVDQAHQLAGVLEMTGIRKLHAIVGASYGGMAALSFAECYPDRVGRLVIISAAHESHPMATGLRALQRRIVALGVATGRAREALVIARGIAMTMYRTPEEFAERFGSWAATASDEPSFEVENYLTKCGEQFADAFTPERYLALSLSLDLHRVIPEDVRVPATLIAVKSDAVVLPAQMRELAGRLGAPSTLVEIESLYGHDSFLKDISVISPIISTALVPTIGTSNLKVRIS